MQKRESAVEVARLFEKQLNEYASHSFRIRHQYCAIRNARNCLHDEEILLHVDFSENWGEKDGAEVQASHFGYRHQITIHQGILYRKVLVIIFYV
jgi:hypothetical protein